MRDGAVSFFSVHPGLRRCGRDNHRPFEEAFSRAFPETIAVQCVNVPSAQHVITVIPPPLPPPHLHSPPPSIPPDTSSQPSSWPTRSSTGLWTRFPSLPLRNKTINQFRLIPPPQVLRVVQRLLPADAAAWQSMLIRPTQRLLKCAKPLRVAFAPSFSC